MQNAIINLNGQILDSTADAAKVSVFDRGFLYGDSLYEVARSYNGEFFLVDQHLKRLENSAHLCKMKLGQSVTHYRQEIYRTFQAFRALPGMQKTEAYARIIVTRGTGKIGFGLNCVLTPTQYVIIIQPVDAPGRDQFEKGIHLQISKRLRNDRRALDPAMKSGNYLNSLLAFLESAEEGYDDAILCNSEGHIAEGTTFNVFYIRRGIIATPPLDIGILDGITRRHTIQIARDLGLEVREIQFPPERMLEAEEVFLTSSIKEVFPVTRLNGKPVKGGKPGPITRRLSEGYKRSILENKA